MGGRRVGYPADMRARLTPGNCHRVPHRLTAHPPGLGSSSLGLSVKRIYDVPSGETNNTKWRRGSWRCFRPASGAGAVPQEAWLNTYRTCQNAVERLRLGRSAIRVGVAAADTPSQQIAVER